MKVGSNLGTVAVTLAMAACSTTSTAVKNSETEMATISIQNLQCADCGVELEARARSTPGVRTAEFDKNRVELHLQISRGASVEPIAQALDGMIVDGKPIHAQPGPGRGAYAVFTTPDPTWDVKVLSVHGQDVPDLHAQASPGKVTVIDFYADWCGPCHDLDDHMHELLTHDRGLAYRRVNVVDWDSPVAKHYLGAAQGLPYVKVLNVRGKEVASISGATPAQLDAAIQKGREP